MVVNSSTSRLLQQCIAWITGFSVSSVIILLILFLGTIILRRKGYGIRLGLACVVLYARPGSRRFPDGVQVRLTTRIVGFLVGGCRGPWLDVYSERFCMRLRPSASTVPLSRRLPPAVLRLPFLRASAVESKYWLLIIQNVFMRLFAFWVRGLRIRVEKVRIWKDGGSWDCKAEQFVFSGRASGLFGSQYSLSMNALDVHICKQAASTSAKVAPIHVTLTLKQGVEISAHLIPRVVTLFRRHRLAILDDLRVCVNLNHVSCQAPELLDASISRISVELCPGYSRSLLAKLPSIAPSAKRPRRRSIIQFFETTATLKSLSLRFSFPRISVVSQSINQSTKLCASSSPVSESSPFLSCDVLSVSQPSDIGGFVRIDSLCFEAYGKTGDERFEGMMHSSISLRGCSAGSASVDALSQALYEAAPDGVADAECHNAEHMSGNVESAENIEKIIAAKPEAMVWVEDVSTAIDINLGSGKNLTKRVDIGGSGCVVAIDPIGLNAFMEDASSFFRGYFTRSHRSVDAFTEEESDNGSAASRNCSSNSLPSLSDEQTSLRLVSDLRHCKILVLSRGTVEDGDTVALVASAEFIVLSQMDVVSSSLLCVKGSVGNFEGTHWSRWDRTKNMTCGKCYFDIQRGSIDNKKLTVKDMVIAWDLDAHSAVEKLPTLLRSLKRPRNFGRSSPKGGSVESVWVEVPPPPRNEHDRIHLSEAERLARREKKYLKFLDTLRAWEVEAENIITTVSFPDGPKLGLSVGTVPVFRLNSETFAGQHVVFSLQDRKLAYAAELRLGSFFHTMSKNLEKRSINIDARKMHVVLEPESQFGYLLQDWLLRLRSTIAILREARWRNRGLAPPKVRKVPMADIHFTSSEVEIHFEDHPISGFLTVMLPLMQDEARERVNRDIVLESHLEKLRKLARAEIAGTPLRCVHALRKKDSEIWIDRVRKMKELWKPREVGNGQLPALERPPAASFTALSLCFDVTLDDLARQMGSTESIRRLKMLDDYELGSKREKKSRQYDRDAWNSIGFRAVAFEATNVCIQLRDYPRPFVWIDRMHFDNTTMGQAVQATKEPYVCRTKVALGRRRVAEVVKALAPTKTFADIHLKVDTLECVFNPSYLAGISDFGRGVSRFFGGGRDPSPRIPWFDSLRVSMHGRMRLTAKKFKGLLTSSVSPYSTTSHFVNFESDNFEMLSSRLNPTEEDPFPISWKFNNWRINPSTFDESRRSQIVFDFVRVGIRPVLTVDSGDPQDHYFVPFPSRDEVTQGGPGTGKGSVSVCYTDEPVGLSDDGFGSFTVWQTGLDSIPGSDTFAGFKTRAMELCIDIHVRHPKPKSHWGKASQDASHFGGPPVQLPQSHSVAYSDAISTLTKVIRTIIRRPISCRLPPRQQSLNRKPPSTTGLSSALKKMHITVDAKNVNVTLHNNLEAGHSLFVSIDSLEGELRKETKIIPLEDGEVLRTSRVARRSFVIKSIYSSIRVPGLDFAVDGDVTGKLFTIDKVSFFDKINDEAQFTTSSALEGSSSPSSGFGSEDLEDSPFYTFSATHPLQRGKPLDKVIYDKRLLVDRVRLIWCPARRISMFAWPDAFKLKTFSMKASKVGIVDSNMDLQVTGFGQAEVAKNMSNLNIGEDLTTMGVSENQVHAEQPDNSVNMSDQKNSRKAIDEESGFKDAIAYAPSCSLSAETLADASILKSPILPFSRSKVMIKKKHVGSMVDLLESRGTEQPLPSNMDFVDVSDSDSQNSRHASGVFETLSCKPKLSILINDCEVGFGSHATSGIVFLTSRSVRVGIVAKRLQKAMQLGEANEEWVDREYRFHLEAANVFTRDKAKGGFNFNRVNWVTSGNAPDPSFALVTQKPICMDLMYISSSSILSNDEDEDETEDYTLRPKLLFINIPNIKLSTNASEFHAVTDVVRKVLMQSMRSSELVNEELSKLRYKLQLAGGKVSTEDLEVSMQRLDCVTRQFLYAGDTFQQHLVEPLMLPNELTFYDNLLRYKAKAKALATFMRKDIGATSANVLFPTMYISYSFDKFSWELREKHKELNREVEDPFVEMALENLVCRHVFYVGRGSSAEVTFANISAQNKMRSSYFQRILQPAGSATNYGAGEGNMKISRIKASDGATVAFRWYSTQEDHVGGISVYDLLTIQVAPMTAAVTRKLYSSVSGFVFSTLSSSGNEEEVESSDEHPSLASPHRDGAKTTHAESSSSLSMIPPKTVSSESVTTVRGSRVNGSLVTSKVDEVLEMAHRGEKNMLFKYVFIDAFELTASYKNKESNARGALDFIDLFVRTPTFSYSSEIWTWKAFTNQVKKDLVKTFVLRGVSNLAKKKLLPGYNRAKKKLARGADTVRETIYNHLPTGNSSIGQEQNIIDEEEDVQDALRIEESDESMTEGDVVDEDDAQGKIDAAMDDISGEEDSKRENVLIALYGFAMIKGSGKNEVTSHRRRRQEYSDSDSNTSYGSSRHRSRNRVLASGQTYTSSSHTSEEGKRGGLGRLLKFTHDNS